MIRAGVLILVVSWLPLIAVSIVDAGSNPIELNLLGAAGKLVGGVVLGLGFLDSILRSAD
jgi:hypothetical protein